MLNRCIGFDPTTDWKLNSVSRYSFFPILQLDQNIDMETMTSNPYIDSIPDEILEYILRQLHPYGDLDRCKLVSWRWYYAVKSK